MDTQETGVYPRAELPWHFAHWVPVGVTGPPAGAPALGLCACVGEDGSQLSPEQLALPVKRGLHLLWLSGQGP